MDQMSAGDWIFGLGPGVPAKFGPKPGGGTQYQFVDPDYWPRWGFSTDDLYMGALNSALGTKGRCNQGGTYASAKNQICGCSYSGKNRDRDCWGKTHMETWYMYEDEDTE